MTRAEALIRAFETAGFRLLTPQEVRRLETAAHMLAIHGEGLFPPPNEQGQKHFGEVLLDSVEMTLMRIAYPLADRCHHEMDLQAACCRLCGVHVEELSEEYQDEFNAVAKVHA
jgi:hypothetical protein